MFRELPPHDEVCETPVGWLPKLPAHWSLERGKSLFKRMQREPSASDDVVTCFRDGVVTLRSNRRSTGYTESLKEIGYQGIRRGDLVIHAMDAFAGAVGVSDSDGKATPVYSVCVPRRDANPHYFAAAVREMARSSWILALSKGVRERSTDFRFEMFATQVFPVPPVEEQAAVVKYLAHANARIDKAITAKRRMIELLREQRTRTVDELVTGREGARQSVSSLPWLDTVPEGWEWRRCRTITQFITSGSRGWAEYYSDRGPIFLQSGNLGRRLDLKLSNIQRVDLPTSGTEGIRTRVRPRDLLVCITGALTGNVAIIPGDWTSEAYINQHIALIRPAYEAVDAEFLGLAMKSEPSQTQFRGDEYGGTKQGLGLDEIKNLYVLLPSLADQQAVVARIAECTARLDRAIERSNNEVALLREFRARLVADVVTGQVDVRGISTTLPDAPESIDSSMAVLDDELEEATGED